MQNFFVVILTRRIGGEESRGNSSVHGILRYAQDDELIFTF
jgi:hypothetical protein